MGTRGYEIVRYRKRYYVFYNHWDSYPEGLGKKLVATIPTNPEEYQKWLSAKREEAARWEQELEPFICIKCTVDEDSEDEKSAIFKSLINVIKSQNGLPTFMTEGRFPAFWPMFKDFSIEWTYTLDLDREIFSIDSGAHFSIENFPRDTWIAALELGPWGERFLLPGLLPEGCEAELVQDCSLPSPEMVHLYGELEVEIVKPKGTSSISPASRHAMLLGEALLAMIQESYQQILSATLLSWGTDDLAFREFAYAILCLASWDGELSLLTEQSILSRTRLPFMELKKQGGETSPEFIRYLAVGCHLDGTEPGSAPNATIYWLRDVLVHLIPRLELHGKIEEGVARTVRYCKENYPDNAKNAVLISIEYVVLVRIYPSGKVEHTELLPLFDFKEHLTMDARGRYGTEYIDTLEKLKIEEKAVKEAEEQQTDSAKQETKRRPVDASEQTMMGNFLDLMAGNRDTMIHRSEDAEHETANDSKSEHGSIDELVKQDDLEKHVSCISEPVNATPKQAEGEEAESNESGSTHESSAKSNSSQADSDHEDPEDEDSEEESQDLAALIPDKIPKDTKSTFFGLFHLFDASARQRMPCPRKAQGRLPTEIYGLIIDHIRNLQTYRACARVSRVFRDLCQQQLMLMDDVCFLPSETTKNYGENGPVKEEKDRFGETASKVKFHIYNKVTGEGEDLSIGATEGPYDLGFGNYKGFVTRWRLCTGSEPNRRSLINGFAIGTKVDRNNSSVSLSETK